MLLEYDGAMNETINEKRVKIIGGGLAGVEASYRLAQHGIGVDLYEMKPKNYSPAHSSEKLAELVCSNSFRSDDIGSAVGLMKEEMRKLDSLTMRAAAKTSVAAGKALAVDREKFAHLITNEISERKEIDLIREEVLEFTDQLTVLAAGPLISETLATSLGELIGADHLHFYDAISPIVIADSVNMEKAFMQSRYDNDGPGDYLNCPMNEEEYHAFYTALMAAEKVEPRDFEKPKYFEGCLPIEVMAARGEKTLTFGPMKPVGLLDPRAGGKRSFAVVQLRKENDAGTLFNMVGFQTRLKQGEQASVLRLIPGLENAEFARFGSVHRNSFLDAPTHLNKFLELKKRPDLLLAGQISGVEGYVESAAMGILAGENAARKILGQPLISPPKDTALGAMIQHLTDQTKRDFQPSNINFGLFPPCPKGIKKKERKSFHAERAIKSIEGWIEEVGWSF